MFMRFIRLASMVTAATLASASTSSFADATPRLVRIGWMSRGGPTPSDANMDAFRKGMRELGYVDGKTYVIEPVYANGKSEVMGQQAAELEASGVDVIIAGPYEAAVAAKQTTRQVPIVMTPSVDPAATGVIANLQKPEGHITAITEMRPDLNPERLRLLQQMVPSLRRLGILWQPGTLTAPAFQQALQATQAAGSQTNLQVRAYEVTSPSDFEQAFKAIAHDKTDGLIVLANPMFGMQRQQILSRAAALKLPVAYEWRAFAQGGGLLSYGPDVSDVYRRAAGMVDKIVKGAKPSELPVEGATLIELVVNIQAARELGLTIPDALQKSATSVIN
jgi:putative tryptophan/tyrosine transport system substrate-binding protein